ncbi:hypothetical protein Y590_00505 [Methylobacterium sp. AMS5]|nr:hypothetical protein Y590_00505 [Methylobacterium sp. AMS5]
MQPVLPHRARRRDTELGERPSAVLKQVPTME